MGKPYFLCVLWLSGTAALSNPQHFQISPSLASKAPDGSLVLAYQEPCGFRFHSALLSQVNASEAEVGVLLEATTVACVGLPRYKVAYLPELRYDTYKTYFAVNANRQGVRYQAQTLRGLHMANSSPKSKEYRLLGTYHSQCGFPFAALLRSTEQGLEVGYLERIPESSRGGQCQGSVEAIEIEQLRFTRPVPKVHRLQAQKLPPRFTTRVVSTEIDQGASEHGVPVLHYKRRCNEAPIGPLLRPAGQGKIAIGMVVAIYPRHTCAPEAPQLLRGMYALRNLNIPPQTTLISIPQGRFPIDLQAPIHIPEASERRHFLQGEFLSSCQGTLGLVVMAGPGGQLHLAQGLRPAKNGIRACKTPLQTVSWFINGPQPPAQGQPELSPLRLAYQG